MNREEIHKLLGGYATGTLTAQEREALFAAALGDQELFDALVNEQPLHALLRDPAARGRLAAALQEPRPRWYQLWWRPALALGGMAALAILGAVILHERPEPARVIARVELPAPKPKPFQPPPPAVAVKQNPVLPLPPKVPVRKLEAQALPFAAPLPPPPQREEDAIPARLQAKAFAVESPKPAGPRVLPSRAPAPAAMGMLAGASTEGAAGVHYTILHRPVGGEFTATTAEGLHPGDEVELRFRPTVSGRITVMSAEEGSTPRLIALGLVAGGSEWVTPVLPAGISKLRVSFIGQNTMPVSGFVERSAKTTADAAQPGTFIAEPPGGQMLVFPITLTYR